MVFLFYNLTAKTLWFESLGFGCTITFWKLVLVFFLTWISKNCSPDNVVNWQRTCNTQQERRHQITLMFQHRFCHSRYYFKPELNMGFANRQTAMHTTQHIHACSEIFFEFYEKHSSGCAWNYTVLLISAKQVLLFHMKIGLSNAKKIHFISKTKLKSFLNVSTFEPRRLYLLFVSNCLWNLAVLENTRQFFYNTVFLDCLNATYQVIKAGS